MMKRFFKLSLLAAIAINANAQSVEQRMVVAPLCLTQQIHAPFQTFASQRSLSLIAINKADISQLAEAKAHKQTGCGGFIDVTHDWQQAKTLTGGLNAASFLTTFTTPKKSSLHAVKSSIYHVQYQAQVKQLLTQINPQNMWTNLTTMSSLDDRYADSDNGVATAHWLKDHIETLAKNYHRDDVTAYFIETGGDYKQPSLVVKVGNSDEPGIVIGAHMDTLSSQFSSKKPGADDDGSGSVVVLETARTILASGTHYKKPIYFIWYAAEEEGLVGSGYVVDEFSSKKIPVAAVMHMDLTGYAYNNKPTMWLIDDYVDKDLTAYLETLINTYVKQLVGHTACGYACSDHANWTNKGYAAAIPAEAKYENTNPNLHSSRDTMDKLSLSHMTDYLKLATAFAVELAEPVAK
jgi:leucyl aminopeptidase